MKIDTRQNKGRPLEAVITIDVQSLNTKDAQLVGLWNIGKSASEIAAELHVTRNAVIGKIWRLRNKGVNIEAHKKPNTKSVNTKSQREKKSVPLLDLIFKKQKEEKIKSVIKHREPLVAHSLNISFKDLRGNSCRYVMNDGLPENFIFCGAPKARGPYCEAHAAICYVPPKLPEQRRRNPNEMQRYYR